MVDVTLSPPPNTRPAPVVHELVPDVVQEVRRLAAGARQADVLGARQRGRIRPPEVAERDLAYPA